MEKFNNKYRIATARASWWDYKNDGWYFITICTHEQQHFFGTCANGKMKLSSVGALVQGFWYDIPNHFQFVELGHFVVMPNHLHGILIVDTIAMQQEVETLHCNVFPHETNNEIHNNIEAETLRATSLPNAQHQFYKNISSKAGSISTIIRSFKSVCAKHIRQDFPHLNFAWQTRFWDNIIRNELAFNTISQYIQNNSSQWEQDKFFIP